MPENPDLTVIEPESERYTADLVLVHGLWVGPGVWRAVASGFAQRGWRCALLDATRAGGGAAHEASLLERAEAAARSLASPPVVIGHDAGGLIALHLADRGAVRAAIAVAPLLDGLKPVLTPARRTLLHLWARGPVPPPSADHAMFAGVPAGARASLQEGLVAEPAARLREVESLAAPGRPSSPALVVAQDRDPVVPRALLELNARGIEADFMTLGGGHWPMLEERIDAWMTQLHRWIVKRAGEGLLLLRGDEDLREE